MCYIMIAKELNTPNPNWETSIKKVLHDRIGSNRDGFFVRSGKEVTRTLDKEEAKKAVDKVQLDGMFSHFRIATVGKISEDNIHGWETDEWVFAHNGGVSDYNDYAVGSKNQEDADSKLFFEDLLLRLQGKNYKKDKNVVSAINSICRDVTFWGRCALYNKVTDKMYLIGDWHIYVCGDSHILLSSSVITWRNNQVKKLHGFNIDFSSAKNIGEETVDGIGVIDNFSQPGFFYRELSSKLERKVYNQNINNTYNDWKDDRSNKDDDDWVLGKGYSGSHTPHLRPVNPPAALPAPTRAPSCEIVTMKENIDNARERMNEQAKDRVDMASETEEVIYKALCDLQADRGFIGYDLISGVEIYLDWGTGMLHDVEGACCTMENCKTWTDIDHVVCQKPTKANKILKKVIDVILDKAAKNEKVGGILKQVGFVLV